MQKRNLSRLMVAAACGLCAANAMAIAPGFYMGLMMGPATNGGEQERVQINPTQPAPTPASTQTPGNPPNTQLANPSSSQFGSRLFLGYKFNQYAGFELGFSYFSGINYIVSQNPNTVVSGSPMPPTSPYQAAAGTTARVRSIDFVGKVDYSYNDTIGLFGKAGVVGVYQTTPGGLQPTASYWVEAPNTAINTAGKLVTTGSNEQQVKLSPTFSLGVSYDLTSAWQADVSWTRLFTGGTLKTMDLFAFGLSYHFVDTYCGQFLCPS